ncbi:MULTISPECIES: hypothetical protein [Acinetobacter]|uniref:hypothetical protein n=1 Tax=Acinetobacter TaxID=469 RepID=UPI00140D1342|nr:MULTISPECIES: hypothetical protein [unclassified Acinetobacter]NHB64473.1 hypothetical protein [Acinetobacter sp. GFQ9D191M]NHC00278.1 hypothetical protein [Acinetobacter sp. GFQ9D192M]
MRVGQHLKSSINGAFLISKALLRHAARQAAMLRVGFKKNLRYGRFFFMYCSKNYSRQAKRVVSNVKKEPDKALFFMNTARAKLRFN